MEDSHYAPFFSAAMIVWACLFVKFWKRKEAVLSVKWGSIWTTSREEVRPEFSGTIFDSAYPIWRCCTLSLNDWKFVEHYFSDLSMFVRSLPFRLEHAPRFVTFLHILSPGREYFQRASIYACPQCTFPLAKPAEGSTCFIHRLMHGWLGEQ